MSFSSIQISIAGANPKLQPNFPTDTRFDITIILNQQTQFKLKRAYLKCWSKFFQKQLPNNIQSLQINQQFNIQMFTKIMSTFYGHTHKIDLKQLPDYMLITSFLQVSQLSSDIRNHLMGYYNQFDTLTLYKLSITTKDQQLKQFVLSILLNNNFQDLIKRKDEVLALELQAFKPLVQYIGKNIKTQTNINWKQLNNILKQYSNNDNELYNTLRGQSIDDKKLSSQEYSTIFLGDSKLPPFIPKHSNKFNISQMIENKSVFFECQILADFTKTLEKYSRNNQRLLKLEERIKKVEQKNESIDELFGKTSIHINQMRQELNRVNSRCDTLAESQSKPFIEDEYEKPSIRIDQSRASALGHSSFGMEQKISSQQPLTFSRRPQAVEESQINILEKFLGFDSVSRGYLKLIYRAQEKSTKQKFFQSIQGKQQLVFLIYAFQDNKHFGIYTSTKIEITSPQNYDAEAFIFSLTNNMKFRTKDPSCSIKFSDKYLISFSDDIELSNDILQTMSTCRWPRTYEGHHKNGPEWLVGNRQFHVTQFEVYQILRIEIKMDMDL